MSARKLCNFSDANLDRQIVELIRAINAGTPGTPGNVTGTIAVYLNGQLVDTVDIVPAPGVTNININLPTTIQGGTL